jgi:hypothetical protein
MAFIDHADFDTIHADNNLKRFDINHLLKDNDYFNDNTLTYIQDYSIILLVMIKEGKI